MTNIRVKISGFDNFARQQVSIIKDLSNRQLERIAKETEITIRQKIQESIGRAGSTGNLAKSFFAERILGGWGIGNVDYLNQNAPYWRHCLDPKTEVYIYIDNKLIPVTLEELYNLYHQRKDIKILAPTGLKNIKNMWKSIHNAVYKAKFSSFYDVVMSSNHRLIYKLNSSYIDKPIETFGSSYIAYSGLMSFFNELDSHEIIKNVTIGNKEIKLNYLFGWIIGFTLAEGCVNSKNKVFWSQDNLSVLKYLQGFADLFGYELRIYRDSTYRFQSNCQPLNRAIKYFCIGVRDSKRINNFFLNTSGEFRKGILKGYNEGDGRKKDVNKYHIRTISKKMRDQLLLIGASLGFDCSLLKTTKPTENSEKSFKSNFSLYQGYIYKYCRRWQVSKYKCTEISKHKLLRTRNLEGHYIAVTPVKTDFKYYPKTLKSIEKINKSKEFIDISVDDELFLINGGLVSHNTNYGSQAIGASHSHRVPQGAFSPGNPRPVTGGAGGRWTVGAGSFSFIPTRPIEPLNYIAKTLQELNHIIVRGLRGVK